MATFIEYLNYPELESNIFGPKSTPIGYVVANPESSLRLLLPKFHVVDYLGILIPSKSEHVNYNDGLRISSVANGLGLVGTIENLHKSDLFRSCEREFFSNKYKREIIEIMKSKIKPWQRHQEPLNHIEAEKYVLIFDILRYSVSVDKLIKFTTHKNYYDPILNEGILMHKNLLKFP